VKIEPFDRRPRTRPGVLRHSREPDRDLGGGGLEFGGDCPRILRAVVVGDRGGVLVPVREARIVLGEQGIDSSGEDPADVADVAAVLQGRPGRRLGRVVAPGARTALAMRAAASRVKAGMSSSTVVAASYRIRDRARAEPTSSPSRPARVAQPRSPRELRHKARPGASQFGRALVGDLIGRRGRDGHRLVVLADRDLGRRRLP